MKAREFVQSLSTLAPETEELLSQGYPGEYAEEFRATFFLKEQTEPVTQEFDDPLLHLIYNYDTSQLEIGMVSLGRRKTHFPTPPDKLLVGAIEADPLVINKHDGSIELLDHAQPDFVMAKCADSSDHFLDALILLASYRSPHSTFKREITEKQEKENNDAARKRAAECAIAAGIPVESNIYEMLLGCE